MTAIARRRDARHDVQLVTAVLALAAVAWGLTAQGMSGMDASPGAALGGVGWFTLTWLEMMAAMMLPALTPMVVEYDRRAPSRRATSAFAAGYLAAWVAAGLVGYVAIESVRALHLGFLAWSEAGRYAASAAIAGAGLYQLSARKRAFLRRCRERREFVGKHYRPGVAGAVRMGVAHGGDCVGSTWALMVALFALGTMSLTWMALVAVLIAAERLAPPGTRPAVAIVLVVLGAGVAIAPADVPGLVVPHTTSMPQMQMQS